MCSRDDLGGQENPSPVEGLKQVFTTRRFLPFGAIGRATTIKFALLLVAIILGLGASARAGIGNTPHNLARGSHGEGQAGSYRPVCSYCHTPHMAASSRALWNRALTPKTYNLYESSTLEANLGQPTGTSRMCLSCHDGTTALAITNTALRPSMTRSWGREKKGSLGMDLSDDHPISFVYDTRLVLEQGQLELPAALPREILLDQTQQVQCTSCHDPHEDENPAFLRMDNRGGGLCIACHLQKGWRGSSHATSSASLEGVRIGSKATLRYGTVAENACGSCHQMHGAPHPTQLLNDSQESGVCLACHDGSVAPQNIAREVDKYSAHRVSQLHSSHKPREDPDAMPRHVSCNDCHNPHQSTQTPATPPNVPGLMVGVSGVDISGRTVRKASFEYEICLKCHGDRDYFPAMGIDRLDDIRNIRLKIDPSNESYHPITAVGRNSTMGGFRPGYTTGSMIYCHDCHNNDDWSPSGSEPKGPHGSRYPPLLEKEYQMEHNSRESFQAFELCYKCHTRARLLRVRVDDTFSHRKHLKRDTSCAVCHDAHGSRDNPGLINFMVRDQTGVRVVTGVMVNGERVSPRYVTSGLHRGKCYLSCHGRDHTPQ